ncbi:ArsR/SmtB family transcription factor [Rhizobium chutanense]|uniref:ArsR family transcriptional regulator n=1 Tax=Rhizobium chutanense TaxID=2035448 RepID=A0A3S0QMT8_9HYPH|nr:metalloregulator ArsR/SmtB family transcription factor [Rhizobium chutanense]RUM07991.1 ArsR family transcriptional regulator [Rhizobium chutanense]
MVQYGSPPLDLSFAALSDATRRGIIDQLGRGDASITSLADRFQMTLTGMKKHVQILERAGLVVTQKVGRVRTCKLGKRGLKAEAEWIEAHRKLFEARFEALDDIISELEREGSDESAS